VSSAAGRRRLGAALQQAVGGRAAFDLEREAGAPGSGLLANPSRARLFQVLLDRPMLHLAGASRACRLAPPSTRWHLKVLKGAGLVQSVRSARGVRYFVTGTVDAGTRDVLLALHRGRSLPLLASVAAAPGRTVRELADDVGCSSQAVLRAFRDLHAHHLIETLRDGKFVRSYPAEGLGRFVSKRASGLPGQYSRVEAALSQAGESVSVSRRSRGELVFQVGRRGARREFRLRPDAFFAPGTRP